MTLLQELGEDHPQRLVTRLPALRRDNVSERVGEEAPANLREKSGVVVVVGTVYHPLPRAHVRESVLERLAIPLDLPVKLSRKFGYQLVKSHGRTLSGVPS